MKMTPEQKAFFEYGGAWETTVVIHTFIRRFLKDKGYQLSPELLHHYRDEKSHYGEVLREAWQKRAACRAWMPKNKRHCANCKYTDCLEWNEPCCECSRCSSYKNVDQWEPRKAADAAGENTDGNPHNSLENVPAQVGETLADGKEAL